MRLQLVLTIAAALTGSPALARPPTAAEAAEATTVIKRFTGAETRAAYAALCEPDTVITDHVPPYVFAGAGACAAHWDAVVKWLVDNKLTAEDYGTPRDRLFADVDGKQLYAVFPASATLTRGGRPEVEDGIWSFVLRRTAAGWRIRAMAWSVLRFGDSTSAAH